MALIKNQDSWPSHDTATDGNHRLLATAQGEPF